MHEQNFNYSERDRLTTEFGQALGGERQVDETAREELGLWYKEGYFRSAGEIILDATQQEAKNKVVFETPLPEAKHYKYWMQRFADRKAEFDETEQRIDHAVISFPKSILVNFIGDTHIGSPYCDYERLKTEIEMIKDTPYSYVILLGDLVDAFFFNAAQMEQIEQTPEQFSFMQSILRYLGEDRKILIGFGGDHDGWAKKMGMDMYHNFSGYTGGYYMQGVGYFTAKVGDEEYRITAAHRLPGYSMYNRTHPQNRAVRFGSAKGSDVVVGAHTHQKGISQQWIQEFGGESNEVTMISLGSYKSMDEYSRKLGYAPLNPQEMYGASVFLNAYEKEVKVYPDILKAHHEFLG